MSASGVRAASIESREQVTAALAGDARLSEWTVRGDEPGFLELEREPVICILAWPEVWREKQRLAPHLIRARSGNYTLILVGRADELADAPVDELDDASVRMTVLTVPTSPAALVIALRARGEADRRTLELADLELSLERARYENDMLIDVGRALSRQRDVNALFGMILRRAREVTGADAGSVYVVEGDDDAAGQDGRPPTPRLLRFIESQNDSIAIESTGFTMPVSPASIVGACVLAKDTISIPDLYRLDAPGTGNNPWSFVHDRSFDQRHRYQTRSMITVPMISARDQVIGVIQLINKRARGVTRLIAPSDFDEKVLPFDDVSTEYASTLASQAGIALENAMLYDEVRTLFEGFVKASVTAIEARDPTTSGHSERVASLTVELAAVADRETTGTYAGYALTTDDRKQLEYAALLHDFGKVGVREHVLVKAMKLYEHDRAIIQSRFDFIRKSMETERLERKVRYLAEASRDSMTAALEGVDGDIGARLEELDDIVAFILQANQPTVLEQGGFERIQEIAARTFASPSGEQRPYLTRDEANALQISRGSLTEGERLEIESHVVHTYNFLRQIPWGRTFRSVPEIAGAHHEKLDGTGYPRGRLAIDIPPGARMMTISDIFDALTASDRPYKKAVPVPKALDILASEVQRAKLDKELFDMFVSAKVWERALKRA
ncbi:MAG TPA: HD domain-containing phosphohydrolase [Kofleriaceae bacterium]|nr:HD domain-containing phosphohydrolase [Kofleriaceae bacterium]